MHALFPGSSIPWGLSRIGPPRELQPESRIPACLAPLSEESSGALRPWDHHSHLQLWGFPSLLQQLSPAEKVCPKQNRAEKHIFMVSQTSSPTLNERYYFWEENVTLYHQNSASSAETLAVSLHSWQLSTQGQCWEIHQAWRKSWEHKLLCD